MKLELLTDPMFHAPFGVGLLCCLSMCLLGPYLAFRKETFAPLAITQGIGATASLGLGIVSWPVSVGAAFGALGLVVLKQTRISQKDSFWLFLWLFSWALGLLVASLFPQTEEFHRTVLEGELLFRDSAFLPFAAGLMVVTGLGMAGLHSFVLRRELLPFQTEGTALQKSLGGPVFDLVVVGTMAGAVLLVGIMATFGLVFFPAWGTRPFGQSWKHSLALCVAFGTIFYGIAFFLSLIWDLPFAPVLLVVLGGGSGLLRWVGLSKLRE